MTGIDSIESQLSMSLMCIVPSRNKIPAVQKDQSIKKKLFKNSESRNHKRSFNIQT